MKRLLVAFMLFMLLTPLAYGYLGPSSYPKVPPAGGYSTEMVDDVIAYMDDNSLTIYRMAFNPATDPDTYTHYYLDKCNYELIVDIYHEWPQGAVFAGTYEARLTKTLDFLATLNATELTRVWIEPFNERADTDLAEDYIQPFIDAVRAEGYAVPIVVDRWYTQTWASYAAITDSANEFYTGRHIYFNDLSLSDATGNMNDAQSAGIPYSHLVNTEVGADWGEEEEFDQTEVDDLNSFLQWSYDRNITNTVWMRYTLENADTYTSMGLEYPAGEPPPSPTPTATPTATPTPIPTAAPEVRPTGSASFDGLIAISAVLGVGALIFWPFIEKRRRD